MNWIPVLTILICFPFLAVFVCWLVLYIRFRYSNERRWAARVFDLLHEAEKSVLSEGKQLRNLTLEREATARSLREKAFSAHLRDYSVDELEEYPGIGPATVGKLRAGGFVNLATLHRAQIRVHGLGEKRLADITYAIQNLLGKARGTFEAGGCRQTHVLAEQLEELKTRYDSLETRSRARKHASEEFIQQLGETVAIARSVTFWRWFRPISNNPLISTEVLDASLPDLGGTLRAAEDRMAQGETAKRSRISAKAVPLSPTSTSHQVVNRARVLKHGSEAVSNSEAAVRDETERMLMELTIKFALGVARKDGPVTSKDRKLILEHVRKRFGDNRALLNRAEAFCSQYERAVIDPERCILEINQRFSAEDRVALLVLTGGIIAVSGKGTEEEDLYLQRLAERFEVPPLALRQRVPPNPSPVLPKPESPALATVESVVPARPNTGVVTESSEEECLRLLEISPSTPISSDLVRRQWNLLSERLAPEKFTAMGPEFVSLAQTKLAALRRAAETLLEATGEQLETNPAAPLPQDLRHNPDLDDAFGGM
ncbi:MAG TPA: TerB family tellurite resistance protein [Gemmataceae bacterium]|jgi:hypothetical protein